MKGRSSSGEGKNAMKIALEEALKKNGNGKSENSAAADADAVHVWEGEGGRIAEDSGTHAPDDQALQTWEGEGGRLEEDLAVRSRASFNVDAYWKRSRQAYIRLGKEIQTMGIKPEELPAWESAGEALESMRGLSRDYKKETSERKRADIALHMRKLGTSLDGRIRNEVRGAAQAIQEDREEKRPGRFTIKEEKAILGDTAKMLSEVPKGRELDLDLSEPEPEPQPSIDTAVLDLDLSEPEPVIPTPVGAGATVPASAAPSQEAKTGTRHEVTLIDLQALYPGREIPLDVLASYLELKEKQQQAEERGFQAEQEAADAEIDSFMAAEREAAEGRKEIPPALTTLGSGWAHGEAAQLTAEDLTQEEREIYDKIHPSNRESFLAITAERRAEQAAKAAVLQNSGVPEPIPGEEADADRGVIKAPQFNASGSGMQEDMNEMNTLDVAPLPGAETRAESKSNLRKAVERMEERERQELERKGGTGTEGTSSAYLAERKEALDGEAKKTGWIERTFRSMGEKYNKLSFIKKLGLGVTLGLGAAVATGFSWVAALGFTAGLAIQRVYGMASVFLKLEKNSQDTKWGKEKSMFGAALYSVGMGYAIGKAVEYAGETEFVRSIQDWLKRQYPLGRAEPTAASARPAGVPRPAPESPFPAVPPGHQASADMQYDAMRARMAGHQASADVQAASPLSVPGTDAAVAGEAPAPVPAFDIPPISVPASTGHGYEYMMKRLWEQLQDKHLDPSNYPKGSDIRTLIEAKPNSIDTVVQQIAADPRHAFFHPDGRSVVIDPGAHMTIGSRGEIHLVDAGHDLTWAPKHLPTTPPYPPRP